MGRFIYVTGSFQENKQTNKRSKVYPVFFYFNFDPISGSTESDRRQNGAIGPARDGVTRLLRADAAAVRSKAKTVYL